MGGAALSFLPKPSPKRWMSQRLAVATWTCNPGLVYEGGGVERRKDGGREGKGREGAQG